jgi:hypothetical protein
VGFESELVDTLALSPRRLTKTKRSAGVEAFLPLSFHWLRMTAARPAIAHAYPLSSESGALAQRVTPSTSNCHAETVPDCLSPEAGMAQAYLARTGPAFPSRASRARRAMRKNSTDLASCSSFTKRVRPSG